jgi:hypothetical protein
MEGGGGGGGGQLGHFHNIDPKSIFQNVLHLILGFTFGVWALYFDFHKFNAI